MYKPFLHAMYTKYWLANILVYELFHNMTTMKRWTQVTNMWNVRDWMNK